MNLEPFTKWLVESEKKSEGTANVYTAVIRTGLKRIGSSLDQNALDTYAMTLKGSNRGVFRSAWRALVRYAAGQGTTLPSVSTGRVRGFENPVKAAEAKANANIPPEIRGALVYLGVPVGPRDLFDLTWGNVRPGDEETMRLSCPRIVGDYIVAKAAIEALRAWRPPTTRDSPLFPRAAGSSDRFPWLEFADLFVAAREEKGLPFTDLPKPVFKHDRPMPELLPFEHFFPELGLHLVKP